MGTAWLRSRWRNDVICALLAGLVSLGGCGSVSATRSPQSATATATVMPLPIATPSMPALSPLVWTSARLPASGQPMPGVAQSDSSTAYACAPVPGDRDATVATWLTHDRGASWQQGASFALDANSLSAGSPIQATSCQIVVDTAQATVAVARVGFLPAAGCIPAVDCISYALYLTTDAGQRWTRLPSPQAPGGSAGAHVSLDVLITFATFHGVAYGFFTTTPRSASPGMVALEMSRDQMRTWTPVRGLAGLSISGFWLNPFNGALLVMSGFEAVRFETSTDSGASWRTLAAPPVLLLSSAVVQQPYTDQPWRICGGNPVGNIYQGVQQNPNMDTLACTNDGGYHWQTLHLDVPNDLGGTPGAGANYQLVGIADDGAPLLVVRGQMKRIVDGELQALGPTPTGSLLVYAAGKGDGVVWSAPQTGDANPASLFTAPYA